MFWISRCASYCPRQHSRFGDVDFARDVWRCRANRFSLYNVFWHILEYDLREFQLLERSYYNLLLLRRPKFEGRLCVSIATFKNMRWPKMHWNSLSLETLIKIKASQCTGSTSKVYFCFAFWRSCFAFHCCWQHSRVGDVDFARDVCGIGLNVFHFTLCFVAFWNQNCNFALCFGDRASRSSAASSIRVLAMLI